MLHISSLDNEGNRFLALLKKTMANLFKMILTFTSFFKHNHERRGPSC
jgi:hypothetical protein